jgi:hypothetical protein
MTIVLENRLSPKPVFSILKPMTCYKYMVISEVYIFCVE